MKVPLSRLVRACWGLNFRLEVHMARTHSFGSFCPFFPSSGLPSARLSPFDPTYPSVDPSVPCVHLDSRRVGGGGGGGCGDHFVLRLAGGGALAMRCVEADGWHRPRTRDLRARCACTCCVFVPVSDVISAFLICLSSFLSSFLSFFETLRSPLAHCAAP
jgi:hypothetical protein